MNEDGRLSEAHSRAGWIGHVLNHSGSPADRRNQYRFLVWAFAWALSFVAASWVLDESRFEGFAAWAVAGGPSLLALAALVAYLRFLREADELIQRVQLDALALGFAVGLLLALGYPLLEQAGAPRFGVYDLAVAMMVAFGGGQLLAIRRYR